MATRTWNGSVSEDWTDPDNWDEAAVPVDGDDVVIGDGAANPLGVVADIDPITFASITAESPAATQTVILGGNSGGEFSPAYITVTDEIDLPGVLIIYGGSYADATVSAGAASDVRGGSFNPTLGFTLGDNSHVLGVSFPDGFPPAGGGGVTIVPGVYTVRLG